MYTNLAHVSIRRVRICSLRTTVISCTCRRPWCCMVEYVRRRKGWVYVCECVCECIGMRMRVWRCGVGRDFRAFLSNILFHSSLVAGHMDSCFGPHRRISGSLELVKIYGRTFGSECLWPCLVIAAAPVRNGARTFVRAGNERRLRTLDVSRCGLTCSACLPGLGGGVALVAVGWGVEW